MRFPQQSLLLSCACASLLPPVQARAQASSQAVQVPAATAFAKARSLYDTPVDAGLNSFSCDVDFDWKDFMQKAANQPVADSDARLRYLQSVHLRVEDDLHGAGVLQWRAATPPPKGSEDSVNKIKDGLEQIWAGFFQTWNGFPTGEMYSLDPKATVEHTATGFHVATHSGPGVAEEQYDNNLLLKSIHVGSPDLEIDTALTFDPGPHGLKLVTIRSDTRQPPSASTNEVVMQIGYAPAASFELPSQLTVSVGSAVFSFRLANCAVHTIADAKPTPAPKPTTQP